MDLDMANFSTPAECQDSSTGPVLIVGSVFGSLWVAVAFFCMCNWKLRGQIHRVEQAKATDLAEKVFQGDLVRLKDTTSFVDLFKKEEKKSTVTELIGINNATTPSSFGHKNMSLELVEVDPERGSDKPHKASPQTSKPPKRHATTSKSTVDEDIEVMKPLSGVDHFADLPDELLVKIVSQLRGKDIAAASQLDTRWHKISKDDSLWKELCMQYWEFNDTPELDSWKKANSEPFKYRTFFLSRAAAFKLTLAENRLLHFMLHFHTTRPFHLSLLLFAVFLFMLGLKLDSWLSASWWVIFFPIYGIDFGLLALIVGATWMRAKFRPGSYTIDSLQPHVQVTVLFFTHHYTFFSLLLCTATTFVATIFLPLRLNQHTAWNWYLVMLPAILLLVAATGVLLFFLVYRRKTNPGPPRQWFNCLFGMIFPLMGCIQVVIIAAKLEGNLPNLTWCMSLLPWWFSEISVLTLTIGACLGHAAKRQMWFAWTASISYAIYIVCVTVLRTLLCNNLTDPQACDMSSPMQQHYPYSIVFIPLQVALLLSGNMAISLFKPSR